MIGRGAIDLNKIFSYSPSIICVAFPCSWIRDLDTQCCSIDWLAKAVMIKRHLGFTSNKPKQSNTCRHCFPCWSTINAAPAQVPHTCSNICPLHIVSRFTDLRLMTFMYIFDTCSLIYISYKCSGCKASLFPEDTLWPRPSFPREDHCLGSSS